MKFESYWDDKNKFENRKHLKYKTDPQLQKAFFDKNNRLIFMTEQTIIFDDAENNLLMIGLISLIILLGAIL